MKRVVIVGPFPPPIHGMAKNLKLFADELSNFVPVSCISTSPGSLVRGWSYHFIKALRVLWGWMSLIGLLAAQRSRVLYMPPDAGFGIYYSLMFVIIARLFGAAIFLHHRSFAYITRKTLGMSLLARLAGQKSTHIFLCERMRDSYVSLYGNTLGCMVVSNAAHVSPVDDCSISELSDTIKLGLMSNLSRDKGVWDAVATVKNLNFSGCKATLVLAGPFEDSETEDFVRSEIRQYPDTIEYIGRVDYLMKHQFYSKIDVFLFPTRYRNEAQPNVLFEAQAAGVPVMAFDRGCIASDIGDNSECLIPSDDNFSEVASKKIREWAGSPKIFKQIKVATLERITHKRDDAELAYQNMINTIVNASK